MPADDGSSFRSEQFDRFSLDSTREIFLPGSLCGAAGHPWGEVASRPSLFDSLSTGMLRKYINQRGFSSFQYSIYF